MNGQADGTQRNGVGSGTDGQGRTNVASEAFDSTAAAQGVTGGVAAIVPAYNEAGRVGAVVAVLRQVASLVRIVVVDDGSSDATAAEARAAGAGDPRVVVLQHEANRGKGQSVMTGRATVEAEYVLLLDADLEGLRPDHIERLLAEVIDSRAEMAVGVFRAGRWNTDLAHRVTPWLSGQRCLRTALLDTLPPAALAGYGLETALTVVARQQRWRCVLVVLDGVSHPPSEFHRGMLRGVLIRARMYRQIARAWREVRRAAKAGRARLGRRARAGLLLLLLLGGGSVAYDRRQTAPAREVAVQILPRRAEGGKLLVIAPHPDDETIGAGGLIQTALARGWQVRVAVLTCGDGQAVAPLLVNGRVVPRPGGYVQIGERRQAETLSAMAELGLSARDVDFLGYPDGRLETLWESTWDTARPVKGRYTRAVASPYPMTFDPAMIYRGDQLLRDIRRIVTEFRPDLVVLPHGSDRHPDHRAAGAFAQMAVALATGRGLEHPAVWAYLVHYGSYPRPRGLRQTAPLTPPRALANTGEFWFELPLTAQETEAKTEAVRRYGSQLRLLGRFLKSFARETECFASSEPLVLTPPGHEGVSLLQPTRESVSRLLIGSADLATLHLARAGDHLSITARSRWRLSPSFRYRVLLKTPDGRTLVYPTLPTRAARRRGTFGAEVDLAALGHPAVVGVMAEIRRGVRVDSSGWRFVVLRSDG